MRRGLPALLAAAQLLAAWPAPAWASARAAAAAARATRPLPTAVPPLSLPSPSSSLVLPTPGRLPSPAAPAPSAPAVRAAVPAASPIPRLEPSAAPSNALPASAPAPKPPARRAAPRRTSARKTASRLDAAPALASQAFDGGISRLSISAPVRGAQTSGRSGNALRAAKGGSSAPAGRPAPPAQVENRTAGIPDGINVRFRFAWSSWLNPLNWPFGLLGTLHSFSLRRLVRRQINELRVEGDSPDYTVTLVPSVEPNAMIEAGESRMWIHLGLLGLTASQDQLAAVVAHEMTHDNPDHYRAVADTPEVSALLDHLEGYKDLPPSQQEEIRADLGALDRMIRAGYNPWEAVNVHYKLAKMQARMFETRLLKRIFKLIFRGSFQYHQDHPASEVRFAAMELFIEHRGRRREDLSEVEGRRRRLPLGAGMLRLLIAPVVYFMTSRWPWLYMAYDLLLGLIGLLGGPTAKAAVSGRVGAALSVLWDPLYRWVLQPIWDYVLSPAFAAIHAWLLKPVWDWLLVPAWEWVVLPVYSTLVWLGGAAADILFWPLEQVFPDLHRGPVGLGLAAAAFVVWKYFARTRSDPYYQDLQALHERATSLAHAVESLRSVEAIYRGSPWLAANRWINGLAWAKHRWLAETRRRLEALLARTDPAAAAALERLPAFALEDARLRSLLERAGRTPSKPLALLREADEAQTAGDPARLLKVSAALFEEGLRDSARRILDRNSGAVLDMLAGPPEPGLIDAWAELEKGLREQGTLMSAGYLRRIGRELKLAWALLRRLLRPLPERMAFLSASNRVPAPYFSPRWWLDRLERLRLRVGLRRRFGSIAELVRFVEAEAAPRGTRPEDFSLDFHSVLASRPRWLSGEEDRRALLASGWLWPKYGTNSPGALESMLIQAVEDFARNYPEPWRYEPGKSEALHALYFESLRREGRLPADPAGRAALWESLTARGVTSRTDALFSELYADPTLSEDERRRLGDLAAKGRLWDPPTRSGILLERLRTSAEYQALASERDPDARRPLLETLIARLQAEFPERGVYYESALETLSREVETTAPESARVYEAQRARAPGERSQDLGLRLLSALLDESLDWSRRQQWRLVLFLRGDAPPTRKIRRAFRVTGPERVRRMFDILPVAARTGLLKGFLTSPRGLLGGEPLDRGSGGLLNPFAALRNLLKELWRMLTLRGDYNRRILLHVQPRASTSVRKTSYEILESFLYALRVAKGSSVPQGVVMAYLLSIPKDQAASTGKTLKGLFQLFGATGVKIGQALAAAELLPEEDTAELRGLQEDAEDPLREGLYADLRRAAGTDDPEWELGPLLGSASIKNVPLGRRKDDGRREVLKLYKDEAFFHTASEFKMLRLMAGRLYGRYGAKYGVFRALVKSAERAVRRELDPAREVERARVAKERIYAGLEGPGWRVRVPEEALHGAGGRLIVSEYAEGVSFWKLPSELQAFAAERVFEIEDAVYYRDAEEIPFDPDRHPGNYRFQVLESPEGVELLIQPIDFGQGLEITRRRREQVHELFALAQIVKETGGVRWALERIEAALDLPPDRPGRWRRLLRRLGLSSAPRKRLARALARYFPKPDLAPSAAYYSLLAAFDDAGLDLDIAYYDFPRGLQQFRQYEEAAPPEALAKSPLRRFEARVRGRAQALAGELRLTRLERLKLGLWRAAWRLSRRLGLDEAWRRLWLFFTAPAVKFVLALTLLAGAGRAAYHVYPEPFDRAAETVQAQWKAWFTNPWHEKLESSYWLKSGQLNQLPHSSTREDLFGHFYTHDPERAEAASALLIRLAREVPEQREEILKALLEASLDRRLYKEDDPDPFDHKDEGTAYHTESLRRDTAVGILRLLGELRETPLEDVPDSTAEILGRLAKDHASHYVRGRAGIHLSWMVEGGRLAPQEARPHFEALNEAWADGRGNLNWVPQWLERLDGPEYAQGLESLLEYRIGTLLNGKDEFRLAAARALINDVRRGRIGRERFLEAYRRALAAARPEERAELQFLVEGGLSPGDPVGSAIEHHREVLVYAVVPRRAWDAAETLRLLSREPAHRDAVIPILQERALGYGGGLGTDMAAAALLDLYRDAPRTYTDTLNPNDMSHFAGVHNREHAPKAYVDALVALTAEGLDQNTRVAAYRVLQHLVLNSYVHPNVLTPRFQDAVKRYPDDTGHLANFLEHWADHHEKPMYEESRQFRIRKLKGWLTNSWTTRDQRALGAEGLLSLHECGVLSRAELDALYAEALADAKAAPELRKFLDANRKRLPAP